MEAGRFGGQGTGDGGYLFCALVQPSHRRAPVCPGLALLHELRDGPEGELAGRGQLLHLQGLHAQEDGAALRRQDRQQEVAPGPAAR